MSESRALPAGGSNRGAVVLVDGTVRRPARENSEAVQHLLRHVRATGFLAVPEPHGFDGEGRENVSQDHLPVGIIDWSDACQGDALFDLAILTLGHEEHLDDVVAGYGTDVDLDVIRAWWSLRSLLAVR